MPEAGNTKWKRNRPRTQLLSFQGCFLAAACLPLGIRNKHISETLIGRQRLDYLDIE
jgi:hypothetical protein